MLVSCVVLAAAVVSTGAGTVVVVVVCEVAVVSGSTSARKAFTSLWIYFIMPE